RAPRPSKLKLRARPRTAVAPVQHGSGPRAPSAAWLPVLFCGVLWLNRGAAARLAGLSEIHVNMLPRSHTHVGRAHRRLAPSHILSTRPYASSTASFMVSEMVGCGKIV